MKNTVLIVGNYSWYFYEDALIDGFNSINIKTSKFILKSSNLKNKIFKFQNLKKINNELINQILESSPDAVFFYRTNEILPSTLKKIKLINPNIKLLFFHNDNPYFGLKHRIKYFLYLACLKYSDITYVYRPSNIEDAKKYNPKDVRLLYPHYCSKIHTNEGKKYEQKNIDIVFIGHYEKNRAEYINALIDEKIKVSIFGPGWGKCEKDHNWPEGVINAPVFGKDYQNTISSSKLALCFLSRINNDVYTRRNFEIPAIGTLVVSEYTKELEELFEVNKEIILFRSKDDLVNQVKKLLQNNSLIEELTLNGFRKVVSMGSSENDRAKQIIKDISEK